VAGDYVNAFEKLRDPSHARCLSIEAWQALFTQHSLVIEHVETLYKRVEFAVWAARHDANMQRYLLALLYAGERRSGRVPAAGDQCGVSDLSPVGGNRRRTPDHGVKHPVWRWRHHTHLISWTVLQRDPYADIPKIRYDCRTYFWQGESFCVLFVNRNAIESNCRRTYTEDGTKRSAIRRHFIRRNVITLRKSTDSLQSSFLGSLVTHLYQTVHPSQRVSALTSGAVAADIDAHG
jgi:hypothetical protein